MPPKQFSDPEAIAEDIIRDVGPNLVVGLPLGLGKANHIINALYARAAADRSIRLTLFSALTLEKPKPTSLLEQRFIGPVHRPGTCHKVNASVRSSAEDREANGGRPEHDDYLPAAATIV